MVGGRLLWFGVLAVFTPIGAHGQSPSIVETYACAEQLGQRADALMAHDWLHLELLAKRYLDTCAEVAGRERLSDAHWSIGIAKVRTGQYEKAIQASDDCIRTFYANPACHLIKAEALIRLNRTNEARSALDLTTRLAEHLLDLAEREADLTEPADREMHQARLNELRSVLRRAEQMRNGLL